MQIGFIFLNASKPGVSYPTVPSKVFNSFDMAIPISKLILTILDSTVLFVAKICHTIVRFESILKNVYPFTCILLDNWNDFRYRAVTNKLGVDLAISLQYAKNTNFSLAYTPTYSANPIVPKQFS